MLNLKFKHESLKKRVVKSLKKKFPSRKVAAETVHASPARLPNLIVAAVCPALARTLSEKDHNLKQQQAALEIKKARFEATKTAEAEKQARIRRGATVMFRENRLHSQQELLKLQNEADNLETALCNVAQEELDTMDAKCNQSTAILLLAAARHDAAAMAALEAKVEADGISMQLRKTLEDAQAERTRLQALTTGVAARFEEAGKLVASATVQQAKADKYLQVTVEQCARSEVLAEGLQMRMGELDALILAAKEARAKTSRQVYVAQAQAVRFATAAEAISVTQEIVEREEAKILEEARAQADQRLAVLSDAQARFWMVRTREKEYLAGRHAHLEELRKRIDIDRRKVKEEKERIRTLEIKRELEMAASVEAKRAALEDLQKAIGIRQEATKASLVAKQEAVQDLRVAGSLRQDSKRVIGRLIAIAEGMASPTSQAVRPITATLEINEDRDGRMSRLEHHSSNQCTKIPMLKSNGEVGFKVYIDTDADKGQRASVGSRYQEVLSSSNGGRKRLEGKENGSNLRAATVASAGARDCLRFKTNMEGLKLKAGSEQVGAGGDRREVQVRKEWR